MQPADGRQLRFPHPHLDGDLLRLPARGRHGDSAFVHACRRVARNREIDPERLRHVGGNRARCVRQQHVGKPLSCVRRLVRGTLELLVRDEEYLDRVAAQHRVRAAQLVAGHAHVSQVVPERHHRDLEALALTCHGRQLHRHGGIAAAGRVRKHVRQRSMYAHQHPGLRSRPAARVVRPDVGESADDTGRLVQQGRHALADAVPFAPAELRALAEQRREGFRPVPDPSQLVRQRLPFVNRERTALEGGVPFLPRREEPGERAPNPGQPCACLPDQKHVSPARHAQPCDPVAAVENPVGQLDRCGRAARQVHAPLHRSALPRAVLRRHGQRRRHRDRGSGRVRQFEQRSAIPEIQRGQIGLLDGGQHAFPSTHEMELAESRRLMESPRRYVPVDPLVLAVLVAIEVRTPYGPGLRRGCELRGTPQHSERNGDLRVPSLRVARRLGAPAAARTVASAVPIRADAGRHVALGAENGAHELEVGLAVMIHVEEKLDLFLLPDVLVHPVLRTLAADLGHIPVTALEEQIQVLGVVGCPGTGAILGRAFALVQLEITGRRRVRPAGVVAASIEQRRRRSAVQLEALCRQLGGGRQTGRLQAERQAGRAQANGTREGSCLVHRVSLEQHTAADTGSSAHSSSTRAGSRCTGCRAGRSGLRRAESPRCRVRRNTRSATQGIASRRRQGR